MKFFNPETKTYKVFNALYNGEKLTASTAQKRLVLRTWLLKQAVFVKTAMLFIRTAAQQVTVLLLLSMLWVSLRVKSLLLATKLRQWASLFN